MNKRKRVTVVAVCQCGTGPYDARGVCVACGRGVHGNERYRRYSVKLLGPRAESCPWL